MKKISKSARSVLLLSAFMLIAGVGDGMAQSDQASDLAMGDAQFRAILEQALQEERAAGDQGAAAAISDGVAAGLPGSEEKETKKIYRYDEKAVYKFYGADLPQRPFNNIDYPY